MDQTITPQDVETSLGGPPTAPVPLPHPIVPTNSITSNTSRHISAPQIASTVSDANIGGGKPPLHHQPTEVNRQLQQSEERNSHTPVVSLLSIDHQQEKDYSSMQSGRRRKPPALNVQNNLPVYHTNGFVPNPFVGFNPQQPPPPPFGVYNNGYAPSFTDYRRINGYDNRPTNNVNKPKRRVYDNSRRLNDHSSRSSLRTDSNSSASCADENRNEEKAMRTAVNTPPPAPYSPMTHHQFKIITNSNAKNYYNKHNNNNNNNYYRPNTTPSGDRSKPNDVVATTKKNGSNTHNNLNSTSNPVNTNSSTNISSSNSNTLSCPNSPQSSNNSQVHLSTTTSQSFVPQAARRNKRSLRRSGGAGINEIGAGDAPLPGEVGEVCKKLESLKL